MRISDWSSDVCSSDLALEPQCGEQRGQFDYDHGQREPPDQIGSVEPPGDEQERQPRDQPQCEPADIGASAIGQRGDVRLAPGLAQCAAPQLLPTPISPPSGTDNVTARPAAPRSEEHTTEPQSPMPISTPV